MHELPLRRFVVDLFYNRSTANRRKSGTWVLPGSGVSPDDRCCYVDETELGDGRDLFDHVIAVVDAWVVGYEGARVSGVDGNRPRRVDLEAGDVLTDAGRERVNDVGQVEVL